MSQSIGVIGDGFGAAALVLHLSDAAPEELGGVTIFGTGSLGSGAAYGCETPDYKLNVRADTMKIWSDKPLHFELWAEQNLDDAEALCAAGKFYQRRDFARYIKACLAAAPGAERVSQVAERIYSARPLSNAVDARWIVTTVDGNNYEYDHLVLANGNPEPIWPCPVSLPDSDHRLIRSVWRGDWNKHVSSSSDITIIGGGLTAMDVIYVLSQAGHQGRIFVVTPNGMLPPVQTPWEVQPAYKWPRCQTAGDVFKVVRDVVGSDWTETSWQESFESLRIELNDVYQGLSPKERNRLMRHLGGWWMLARFRCGPHAHMAACAMEQTGQLQIVNGRARTLNPHQDKIQIALADGSDMHSDYVINCSGPARDVLLDSLLDEGFIKPSPTFRGLDVSQSLACYKNEGELWASLSAIGGMTGGSLGDIVAASSIAQQARIVAERLTF